jgi:cytochrome c biogenesis protein CcmG/thiol:disulfide interchange protein DsbE
MMGSRVSTVTLIPVAAFAVMTGMLLLAAAGEPRSSYDGYLDRPVPNFAQSPLMDFESGLSNQDIQGKVVIINVFASWCSVCRSEHPMLMRLAAEAQVPLYGLNWRDTQVAGEAFLNNLGDPYLATGMDPDGELGAKLDVTGVPETYVIGADGRIRYRHIGALTEQVWQQVLRPLILRLEGSS